MRDVQVLILFTIFLSRHLLLRLYLSWDPYTVRTPRNGLTVLLQSHVLQGTVFDRRCRDVVGSSSSSLQGGVYEWTDIIPSSILYLYYVARVYVLVPLTAALSSSKRSLHQLQPPQPPSQGGSHNDEVHQHHHSHHNHHHNHNKKQMETSLMTSSASSSSHSSSSSRWFYYWRQRVYSVWFDHIAPRVSLHWCIWIFCTMDALSLGMRLYYLTDQHVMSSNADSSRRLHGGKGLDRLVILTGTALHHLDDAVVANGHNDDYDDFFTTPFPHRRYIPLYRQFYMAAILSSVFTTGRLWNAPPDFYPRPMSDIATVAYVGGRWLEVMILLDLLPVQPCRAEGYCPKHCALSATGYADFRRDDCDHPDVFYAWTFLVMSATILLFGTLTAQSLTHSYAIWRNAIIRARVEWKRVEPTTTTNSTYHNNNNNAPWLSNLMTTLSVPANWKDVFLQWDFFFVEKERYHRGERYHTWWWGRRTYECIKATTRPPPFFFINSVDNNDNNNTNNNGYGVLDATTTPILAWLVPIAQMQWLIGAFYLIAWLVRFFFFGIYSAWVYGLYAMVAHCMAANAVTYPESPIKKLAQEVNDRPKKYRL
jgi:hypothetical protein